MELKNVIKRDYYLRQLIEDRQHTMIKIVTGLRGCGKTVLVFNLFVDWLHNEGVDDNHIIRVSLDSPSGVEFRNPHNMMEYLQSKIGEDGVYYVLIDEVPLLDDFVGVLNGLLHRNNVSTYVTGSNSKYLSKDVVTEFRGRGEEIHVYPFSFAEFYGIVGGDEREAWVQYSKFGGMPELLFIEGDEEKSAYLTDIIKTVYLRDVLERYNIRNPDDFMGLMQIMASNVGSSCNPNNLSKKFKNVYGTTLDPKTISNYLDYMDDISLLEQSEGYDLRWNRCRGVRQKYYFQDIGIRNAAIKFREIDEGNIIENVVYNELRRRRFEIHAGFVETWRQVDGTSQRQRLDVDFVADRGSLRYYIQSARHIFDKEEYEKETAVFRKINDSFRRVLITKNDVLPYHDYNGYYHLSLLDFLLKPELLAER